MSSSVLSVVGSVFYYDDERQLDRKKRETDQACLAQWSPGPCVQMADWKLSSSSYTRVLSFMKNRRLVRTSLHSIQWSVVFDQYDLSFI